MGKNLGYNNTGYLATIDLLRGIAALAVCFLHFTNGNRTFLPADSLLKSVGYYGTFGVHVFFVISGIVIPYALHTSGYKFSHFGTFLLKRLIRIEPPYLLSIVIVILFYFVATLLPIYRGAPFHLDGMNLLFHLGYLNSFMHAKWLNPVYWSLAVEFQYYIFIALLFPLLQSAKIYIWLLVLILFTLTGFVLKNENFFFFYSLYFALGILYYKYVVGAISKYEYIILAAIATALIYPRFGLGGAVAALFPLVVLIFVVNNRVSRYLGRISFSVYLLHVPVGVSVINLSQNLGESMVIKIGAIILAFLLSIIAADLFNRFVEEPCKRMAKAVTYRRAGVKLQVT